MKNNKNGHLEIDETMIITSLRRTVMIANKGGKHYEVNRCELNCLFESEITIQITETLTLDKDESTDLLLDAMHRADMGKNRNRTIEEVIKERRREPTSSESSSDQDEETRLIHKGIMEKMRSGAEGVQKWKQEKIEEEEKEERSS